VLLQTEDLAVVESDPLEHAVSIEKAVVEHRDLGLGLRVESTVDIDLHDFSNYAGICPGLQEAADGASK
jgi:hypothetical protein